MTRTPGEATGLANAQVLAGVKVLEFTAGMAGPWIGRRADAG